MTAIICNPPMTTGPQAAEDEYLTCQGVMLARTVPEETANGDVTVCSAWWAPALTDNGLVRIYPMPVESGYRAWRRYDLELTKSDKDPRWRSYKLGIRPEEVAPRSLRDDLKPALKRLAEGTTIDRLNEKRDSMGVIRPQWLEWSYETGVPDLTRSFGRRTFGLRPRLKFADAAKEHNLALNEWGCYEFLRKGHDPEQLWSAKKLGDPAREYLLLVGNYRDHLKSWVVIDVISYEARQPALFLEGQTPLRDAGAA